ncbi:unnamed protein product, partial [Pelagomonas calceolata]
MSKRQTRLLVVPQILPPRGVVVATGEEVAVGAPPAHVPGVGLGPRFHEIQRFHAGVRRAYIARAEDGRALLLRGERSVQNFLVGGPVRGFSGALLELEPRLPS